MSEKSGYGAQIFILIIAVVVFVSLSRVKNLSRRGLVEPPQHEQSISQEAQTPKEISFTP